MGRWGCRSCLDDLLAGRGEEGLDFTRRLDGGWGGEERAGVFVVGWEPTRR